MLKNYLTITFRTLTKQKLYAVLNIVGLAVGLACFLLIALYVQHELSYDRFHEKSDRIYRVVQQQPGNVFVGTDHFAVMPAPLASTLTAEYPEVEAATAFSDGFALLSHEDQHFYEDGLWADASFFEVLAFPFLQGDAATALAEPNQIVLTASLAEKLFGSLDVVGRTLMLQNRDPFTVSGVLRDVPENAHFRFTFAASIHSFRNFARDREEGRWGNNSWYTYFLLAEGAHADALEAKMPALVDQYLGEPTRPDRGQHRYYFQALPDIHLRSSVNFDLAPGGDMRYVLLYAAIALVILLLACVNYTNLAVARSIKRAREVGMRKAVGAGRGQLVRQFLGESVLMAFGAMLLALVLAHLAAPLFSGLVERPLRLDYMDNGWLVPGLLGLTLLVGVVAGSYPALFMSALRPAATLKGAGASVVKKARLQRLLIVGQYTVSIALVVGSLVIDQQLRYVQHTEAGYDRDHVLTVRLHDRSMPNQYATLRHALLENPQITHVTSVSHLPTNIRSSTTIQGWDGSAEDDRLRIYQALVDYDFLQVFGIPLAAGRSFSPAFPSDTLGAYLINETAARAMGWTPEEAVGQTFQRGSYEGQTIIGVVRDFHLHSFHEPIAPLMISLGTDWMSYLAAKVRPNDLPATTAFLEETVQSFTAYPVEYAFLDDTFDEMYRAEVRLGETFGYFTLLALLIASLGLFGLAAFAAEQRTKEIGIRKVMGASVGGLMLLLSKEFTRLVLVAFVLAAPLAYLAMNRWLEDFAYRIELSWPVFVGGGVAALVIAWLSVSYQSLRAASVNPVHALRYE